MKDFFICAGFAGIIGNIPKEILTWIFYFIGLIKYTNVHFCAGLVVNPVTYLRGPLSVVIGMMIDYTIATVFSVGMYLALRKTGTDHWLIKGWGFGMIVFLLCYGILRPTFSIRIESPPLAVLMYMIPNWIYGITTCGTLKKYGEFKL